jgi:hypothetical protein
MKQIITTAEVQALKREGFTDDLIAKNFEVKINRNHTFSQEEVQQHAINVLAVISIGVTSPYPKISLKKECGQFVIGM